MTLDDLIQQCLQWRGQRKYRAPSGQIWIELERDARRVVMRPEYPTSRSDTTTIPLKLFETLNWVEIDG